MSLIFVGKSNFKQFFMKCLYKYYFLYANYLLFLGNLEFLCVKQTAILNPGKSNYEFKRHHVDLRRNGFLIKAYYNFIFYRADIESLKVKIKSKRRNKSIIL